MSQIRGRFSKAADKLVQQYTQSIDFDYRLGSVDAMAGIVHARMLAKQGIISKKEAKQIIDGLEAILSELEQRTFNLQPELEDIHMNIEARLIEKIGDVGRKLHTARSRNDQVATDIRLYLMVGILTTIGAIRELERSIVDVAEKNIDVIAPGYTHLQRAQPVLLAHHLMAYFEMLERDVERFWGCMKRTSVLPLGSGALAGVPYPIDRQFVAKELGFEEISQNSIDAVSDRDFILEYEFNASVCMMHISRLSEELVLWSSAEFDFIEIDDAFTTGSSIMPQKKNPDVAELARGKTGRVYGSLMALLTTMKGLPLAYDRDLQEDKEGIFDSSDTLLDTINIFSEMLRNISIKTGKLQSAVQQSYMLATDIADYLVKKGEPFRTAHAKTGKIVRFAMENGKALNQLTIQEYKKFSSLFDNDVFKITVESSIAARNQIGGTAKEQVTKQLARARAILREYDEELSKY
ncbi:MAG: argininosuccinate lyase [Chloroflexi bacterium RBG_13_46_9]|jgi:argininosuccinate lyase|nr:MAG: argininosuccinate lyase [Chloroflexi bacterium RBG_13_46_9]